MTIDYCLRMGRSDFLPLAILANLDSADASVKRKAEAGLQDRLTEARVRVGTLLKTDNVSFLFGAGASISAGGVSMQPIPLALERSLLALASDDQDRGGAAWSELFYETAGALTGTRIDADERRTALERDQDGLEPIALNLETYLSHLHMWSASLIDGASSLILLGDKADAVSIDREALGQLIRALNTSLAALLDLPKNDKEGALQSYRRLLKKVLTRPLNLRRANLFTLNYDLLVEKAADAEGVILVDGFLGTLRRIFRPESYDLDFYFPAQTTEGRVHRFDRALHLYKLHGSLSWHRTEANWDNPYGVYSTLYEANPAAKDDVLIYPSPLKYGQALDLPYSELFRRFGSAIAQPQSVLFVMGYGFGDDHVNSLIRQALAIPSFTLVVIDPEPKSSFVQKLKELGDERVWIVSGWKLGTFDAFVEKLLPDLREEEIATKVLKTYKAIAHPTAGAPIEPEESDGD